MGCASTPLASAAPARLRSPPTLRTPFFTPSLNVLPRFSARAVAHRSQGVASSTCSGHGTHCASTAAGATYGVAKSATIVTVQVLSCSGTGSGAGVIAGIDWAVDDAGKRSQKAVISMSLGGGFSASENQAIATAVAQDVVVVAAAGNDDSDACSYSPASAPEALTVGSTTQNDVKSSFSNHGSCVDIHAPGSSITAAWSSSDSSIATISGTSMACPHVAGAALPCLETDDGPGP